MRQRTALVTGANRGLGRAVAAALHATGMRVWIAARKMEQATEVAEELGGLARAVELDTTDQRSVQRALNLVGLVDVLVNNAGVLAGSGTDPLSVSLDDAEQELTVNVLGTWRVCQAFVPGMLENGWGRVVMISSGTASFGAGLFGGAPGYTTSKVALNALTVLLAEQTRNRGVLVNAVNPGRVRTRMMADAQRTPEEAAGDIVYAATLPDDGPTGAFLRIGRVVPW